MMQDKKMIEEEKLKIGKKYIAPQVIKAHGINEKLIKFNEDTIATII